MRRIQIFRTALFLTLVAAMLAPNTVSAQTSSVSTFSPYTMYGIGSLNMRGNAELRTMGGAGVAFRNPYSFNYLNPASLSAIPQHSAIFNFGGEGQNFYSKTATSSTSHNSFNVSDIGLAFPLANGVGLGFSMTPVSSVGYETTRIDDNSSVVENIGRAVYSYRGEGGISQVSANLGVRVVKGLSLGASANYYFGSIDRFFNASMQPLISAAAYSEVLSFSKLHFSDMVYSLGFQYQMRVGRLNSLTVGGTYQFKSDMRPREYIEQVGARNTNIDTIAMSSDIFPITIPAKIEAGITYRSEKFMASLDYSHQNWKNAFAIPADQHISLRAEQQIRLGASYTPNMNDMRTAMNRWTYKIGLRYGTSYLQYYGQQMNDYAASIGLGIPLKRQKASRFTIGVELGQRGTISGQQVRERYVNVFAGLSLFGEYEEGWFRRQKFR